MASSNPNLVDYLVSHHFDKIDWKEFSKNPAAVPTLEKYPENIYWQYLCKNTNPRAMPLIEQNLHRADRFHLSANLNAIPILERYPDNIEIEHLATNPNGMPLFEKYLHCVSGDNLHDIRTGLSMNPSAIPLLVANPILIDWQWISQNPAIFVYDYNTMRRTKCKSSWICEYTDKIYDPNRIQRYCEKYEYNPLTGQRLIRDIIGNMCIY